MSLLAAHNPMFLSHMALVTTSRKVTRIVEVRANCVTVYHRAPLADLSNVEDVVVLTHGHHSYAEMLQVV